MRRVKNYPSPLRGECDFGCDSTTGSAWAIGRLCRQLATLHPWLHSGTPPGRRCAREEMGEHVIRRRNTGQAGFFHERPLLTVSGEVKCGASLIVLPPEPCYPVRSAVSSSWMSSGSGALKWSLFSVIGWLNSMVWAWRAWRCMSGPVC